MKSRPTEQQKSPQSKDLRFLTVAEVATLLRISHATVYRLADTRELPAYRIRRKRLFKYEDVLSFIDRCASPRWTQ
jgi:excisionase family DNA binding protein